MLVMSKCIKSLKLSVPSTEYTPLNMIEWKHAPITLKHYSFLISIHTECVNTASTEQSINLLFYWLLFIINLIDIFIVKSVWFIAQACAVLYAHSLLLVPFSFSVLAIRTQKVWRVSACNGCIMRPEIMSVVGDREREEREHEMASGDW